MADLKVALSAAVIVALAACSGGDGAKPSESPTTTSAVQGSPSTSDLAPRAAEITDLMVANDWSAVREDFDATMLQSLSEARLGSTWQELTAQVGRFKSRGEPTEIPKDRLHIVFDTPMTFERAEMKGRVAFNYDGTVAGLFILVPAAE